MSAPMPQDEVEAMVEQLRDTTCNERSPCFALYNDEAAALLTRLSAQLKDARWIFAQIGQMHSTDNGDIAERCMELGQKGYALLKGSAPEEQASAGPSSAPEPT